MRSKELFNLQYARDTEFRDIIAEMETGPTISDYYTEHDSASFSLGAGATDQEIANNITKMKFIAIKSNGKITVKIDDIANTPIPVEPRTTDDAPKFATLILQNESITKLFITNPGAVAVTVEFVILGGT